MAAPKQDFANEEALLDRLARVEPERKVVFLVGSAMTMPVGGEPGVADVTRVGHLVRAELELELRAGARRERKIQRLLTEFDAALAKHDDLGARYQESFKRLKARTSPDKINRVIRRAVLQARSLPSTVAVDDIEELGALEGDGGWHLGPGVKALGSLLAAHPERFARTVLTTNFDPLIELAVRRAGGQAATLELLGDQPVPVGDHVAARVVHVHGTWLGDTLHTPGALTVEREQVVRSLARLFDQVTLVVIGYAGWDDVLTEALARVGEDAQTKPDLIWCFYEESPEVIARLYAKVLDRLGAMGERAQCYRGVNCHTLLPKLRALVDGECEVLGRRVVIEQLDHDAGKQAVELLGEAKMGRSTMLRWLEGQARADGEPVAVIKAEQLVASPVVFVRAIGEQLGCQAAVEERLTARRAEPGADDAGATLELFDGATILVDNADHLARPGHGFTVGFFDVCRAKVQGGKLRWVSISPVSLGPLFKLFGVNSPFLNDVSTVYIGGLELAEVRMGLAARLGRKLADQAFVLTGTLPVLVGRLCEARSTAVAEVRLDGLGDWAESIFTSWWARDVEAQILLMRALERLDGTTLDEAASEKVAQLIERGLLREDERGLLLNGRLWEAYVRSKS